MRAQPMPSEDRAEIPRIARAAPIQVAGPATIRPRHRRIAQSFVACVILPLALCAAYLWGMARDQYVSTMSFSVRTENMQSALDLLGGFSGLMSGGSGTNDVGIIEQFIASPDLVARMERDLHVSQVFALGWPRDFALAFDPSGKLEDLHDYWRRAVVTSSAGGLITLSVRSYDAQRSNQIARAVFEESKRLVNTLSTEAREDATRLTREDLVRAEARLSEARAALTAFRLRTQIVDPGTALQAQVGIIADLQARLSEQQVQRDLLRRTAPPKGDPRLAESDRKIDALEQQIALERAKFGAGGKGPGGEDYATLFAQYERLAAELRFSEETYRAATVAHDAAQTAAKATSRYLVMHVQPTIAEKSVFPDRPVTLMIAALFLMIAWSIGLLVYYSIRDRR